MIDPKQRCCGLFSGSRQSVRHKNSGQRRHLAARKLYAIMRRKFLDLAAQRAGIQIIRPDAKDFGDDEKFQVGNAAASVFQPGNRALTGIPARQLQLRRKLTLVPAFLFTNFVNLRPHDIQGYVRLFLDAGSVTTGDFYFSALLHILLFDFACQRARSFGSISPEVLLRRISSRPDANSGLF